MKYYDYKKAKRLIEESKDCIQSASLGMHEDWFWTANTVFEDGEWKVELFQGDVIGEYKKYVAARHAGLSIFDTSFDYFKVGGICCSEWGTPTLQLIFNDGEDKMIPCFIQEGEEMPLGEKVERMIQCTSGCLSAPVQQHITPLSNE